MQPGKFKPPGDESWLVREVQELKGKLQRLEAANPFGPMGIKPVSGGFAVTGTMDLPTGIIQTDALAQPLQISAISADADAFTLTTADQDFCVASFTVPAGYTAATIDAVGTVNTYNTNAASDYLWAQAFINSVGGRRMFTLMQATSGPASLTVNRQTQLTGLTSGQVITCKLVLSSQVASITSTSNGASMNAKAFFTR